MNLRTPDSQRSNRFSGRLRDIRAAGARASERARQRRSEADRVRADRILSGFEFLAAAEALVQRVQDGLLVESPELVRGRRFFDGRYELSLRATSGATPDAGQVHDPSQIVFLLAPRPDEGRFEIECRRTVRKTDMLPARLTVDLDESSLPEIERFVEARTLEFANAWFGPGGRQRTSLPSVDRG